VFLVAIQGVDGVVQPAFGIQIRAWRKGIVDARGPIFFLEDGDHHFLVGGGDFELLDQVFSEPQLLAVPVPAGAEFDEHASPERREEMLAIAAAIERRKARDWAGTWGVTGSWGGAGTGVRTICAAQGRRLGGIDLRC